MAAIEPLLRENRAVAASEVQAAVDAAPDEQSPARTGWHFSIRTVLAGAVIVLATLSVATLLFVLIGSRNTTVRLINDRHRLILDNVETTIRHHFDPVREQAEFLAVRMESGDVLSTDRVRIGDLLLGALAASPQVLGVNWVTPDYKALRAVRFSGSGATLQEVTVSNVIQAEKRFARVADRRNGYWDEIVRSSDSDLSLLNYVRPVWAGERLLGAFVSVVSVAEFSRYLSDIAELDDAGVEFVLYGRNEVLAHPVLAGLADIAPDGRRLLLLEDFPDRVLAGIWRDRQAAPRLRSIFSDGEGHITRTNGKPWAFIYRSLEDYGDEPLIVGRYYPGSEISDEFRALVMAGVGGLFAVLLGIGMAWWVGRSIGKPVRQIAMAARRLREFEFDGPRLKGSWLIELDEASRAFNSTTAALKWFGQYVPRRLVTRLISEGESAVTSTKYRDVAVMFTDLAGFTSLSEELPAETVAALLNDHFALVAECIDDEDGVIDKFIGDAVMACWGAIKRLDDHSARACRAALAIAAAVKADNARRRERGEVALRMRIGIHAGKVVVGNIGAPGRINYTVVGDTVNTAQRLEAMGKTFLAPEEDVVVLVSSDVLSQTGLQHRARFVGDMEIRGRRQPEEVFRLI